MFKETCVYDMGPSIVTRPPGWGRGVTPLPPGSDHGDQGSFEPDTCRPLREYLHPPRQTTTSCIVLPINHHTFNLKSGTI